VLLSKILRKNLEHQKKLPENRTDFQEKSEVKKFFEFVGKIWGTLIFLNRAQSYQQTFSDLRNFLKKSENFKPKFFVRKVRKII
jgi:hypothetical protein